jgi:hypothetical protein
MADMRQNDREFYAHSRRKRFVHSLNTLRANLFRACGRDLTDFSVTVSAAPVFRATVLGIYGLHTQL